MDTLRGAVFAAFAALALGGCGGGAGTAANTIQGAIPATQPASTATSTPQPSAASPTPQAPAALQAPVPASQVYWIVSEAGIEGLETKMNPTVVNAIFNDTRTYEIMDMINGADPLPSALHLLYYRDETLINGDIASGKFNGIAGALYDDEAYKEPGNTTPAEQIADPVPYAQAAAATLHAAGKLFVYTIGQNTGPSGAFLTSTLPSVSKYPDVIDFQTQSAEGTPNFASEVDQYSPVYFGNGGHRMLVGIGADPTGLTETASNIESAYVQAFASKPEANGFWLNLAVKSQSCVSCLVTIDYGPLLSFFNWLGYTNTTP